MIKVKVPIEKISDITFRFSEFERSWIPLMPVSYYLAPEFDGVQINRVIWNGRSIPDPAPKVSDKGIPRCPDRAVFDQIIPRDGDELIVIPAFGEAFSAATIFGIAIAGSVYGVSGEVLNVVLVMAISMLVNGVISYLTAPAKPKGQSMSNSASTVGWQGYQNSYGPGGPIPVSFGPIKSPCSIVEREL